MKLGLASLFADPDVRISRHQFRLLKVVFALWQTVFVGFVMIWLFRPMMGTVSTSVLSGFGLEDLRVMTRLGVLTCLSGFAAVLTCWALALAGRRSVWGPAFILAFFLHLWFTTSLFMQEWSQGVLVDPAHLSLTGLSVKVLVPLVIAVLLSGAPAGDDRPWSPSGERWLLRTADVGRARGACAVFLGLFVLELPHAPNMTTAGVALAVGVSIALTCFRRTRRWGWWGLALEALVAGLSWPLQWLWASMTFPSRTATLILDPRFGLEVFTWVGLAAVMFLQSDANWFKPRPAAAGGRHVVLFDGNCGLCTRIVRFLIEEDFHQILTFAPLAGPTARPILERAEHAGPGRDTLVYVRNCGTPLEVCYTRSDAVLRILRDIGGFFATGIVLLTLPCWLRDAAYCLIARWRGRLSRACGWQPLLPLPPDRFLP